MPEAATEFSGVWVYLEHADNKLVGVSKELLGAGRKLADELGTKLCGAVAGDRVEEIAEEAFSYMADVVYAVKGSELASYRNRPFTSAIVHLVRKYKPEIFLVGATTQGRDLAGSVATRLETGLTADCTELSVDPSTRLLYATRPTFGGNLMATILCEKARPQMATVRPRVLEMPKPASGRKGELIVEEYNPNPDDLKAVLLEVMTSREKEGPDLEMANVIVAGGRGLGDPKKFEMLEELASLLDGVVASSRPPVEAGWIGHERQVGQTGLTVRPRLYIACGISGAVQHIVGMKNSDVIVAINIDENAPIFNIADYGIVGDLNVVVPVLIEQVKELSVKVSKR